MKNGDKQFEEAVLVTDSYRLGRFESATTEENLNIAAQNFLQSLSKSAREADILSVILEERKRFNSSVILLFYYIN